MVISNIIIEYSKKVMRKNDRFDEPLHLVLIGSNIEPYDYSHRGSATSNLVSKMLLKDKKYIRYIIHLLEDNISDNIKYHSVIHNYLPFLYKPFINFKNRKKEYLNKLVNKELKTRLFFYEGAVDRILLDTIYLNKNEYQKISFINEDFDENNFKVGEMVYICLYSDIDNYKYRLLKKYDSTKNFTDDKLFYHNFLESLEYNRSKKQIEKVLSDNLDKKYLFSNKNYPDWIKNIFKK